MSDWYNLSKEQHDDVQALRERITQNMIAETEAFYRVHPEIQVTWSVTLDGFTREKQEVTR